MAKAELGTKRACPESGRNFYDLNNDPVVSPYTGKQYPLTFFEVVVEQKKSKVEATKVEKPAPAATAEEDEDDNEIDDGGPEIISLEDADETVEKADSDDVDDEAEAITEIPSVDIDEDDESEPDNDTFLEEEDDDTDLSDVIGARDSDNKEDL